jgi:plasmid stabilization system protein ParE
MPRGEKSTYTAKQERKADHIAEHYEAKGVSEKEAERRAWATVNKDDGGGKKSGSGRGKSSGRPAARQAGEKVGKAAASRTGPERSASAKKAAATRKRNAEPHAHP